MTSTLTSTHPHWPSARSSAAARTRRRLLTVGLVLVALPVAASEPAAFQRLDARTLEVRDVLSAVSDGTHGYFGTAGQRVVKLRLSDLEQVGEYIDSGSRQGDFSAMVSDGSHGYFGIATTPGRVIKVRLSDMTGVADAAGAVDFATGVDGVLSAVADGTHGYFGTMTGHVVKVELATMEEVQTIDLGEGALASAVIVGTSAYFGTRTGKVVEVDLAAGGPAGMEKGATLDLGRGSSSIDAAATDGTHGYFVSFEQTSHVVKVDLAAMQTVGTPHALPLNTQSQSAIVDEDHGYFGTNDGRIFKLQLSDLTDVGETVTLESGEVGLRAAIVDGTNAYFGTLTEPGRVVKVQLREPITFKRVGGLELAAGEGEVLSAIADETHGYFGTATGEVVKVRLSDLERVAAYKDTGSLLTGAFGVAVSDGTHGYFGLRTSPARVVKVRLSDMTAVGDGLNLAPAADGVRAEATVQAAVTDGTFGWFGLNSGHVVKVDLATMEKVGDTLDLGSDPMLSAIRIGSHGYFGTQAGKVVKVDLTAMVQVGDALDLAGSALAVAITDGARGYFVADGGTSQIHTVDLAESGMTRVGTARSLPVNTRAVSAVTDGTHGYFGTDATTGQVLKVLLSDLTILDDPVTLESGEGKLTSAVRVGADAYFGTSTDPGRVIKVQLTEPEPATIPDAEDADDGSDDDSDAGGDSGSESGSSSSDAESDPVVIATSDPSLVLSCVPALPIAGGSSTCTVVGGDPSIEILWRAAYNPVFAGGGVALDAAGTGTFSFEVPAAALGEDLTVELVGWAAPVSLGVVRGPIPTSVPSGGGPLSTWAGVPPVLVAVALLRRRMLVKG